MKLFVVLFCLAAFAPALFSQQYSVESHDQGRLLFAPLIANYLEPRVGMSRLVGESRLRLDIGNSIDLFQFEGMNTGDRVAVGADFFTWTSLRQDADFHFPVDAVDYLFGLNAAYIHDLDDISSLSVRLRLSHISAHLVDGSYNKSTEEWRDGELPQVYSREFLEIIFAYEFDSFFRAYTGGQYIYHIDPADLGKLALEAGFEGVLRDGISGGIHLYIAYDFRLLDNGSVRSAHAMQAGVKFGPWRGSGINIFCAYYHGPSQHGEYYDRFWSYWGPGLNIDF
jgi:Protein of unknown function (DUF1207)